MKTYTEAQVREIAERGKKDPASLTADEIRAVSLYVTRKRLSVWGGEKFVALPH